MQAETRWRLSVKPGTVERHSMRRFRYGKDLMTLGLGITGHRSMHNCSSKKLLPNRGIIHSSSKPNTIRRRVGTGDASRDPKNPLPIFQHGLSTCYRITGHRWTTAAFQAFLASGGLEDEKAARGVYFPITLLPEKWDEKKLKWLTSDLMSVIEPASARASAKTTAARALADLAHFSSLDKHRKASANGDAHSSKRSNAVEPSGRWTGLGEL